MVANFNVHLNKGSGGNSSRPTSNFFGNENDESDEAYFVDAREQPGSSNPISSLNSIVTRVNSLDARV